ncbi:alkane 1-monooxygenase [Loktanella sp. S4079]|uniref:alkane 1-monooxygenase n=1 Tax=Loktanella sp. S4079 TaxID=579483 RepID=UPI0012EE54DF|nr:alkane 1-monooxygenase [Loktanella sp. S4079]
MRQFTIITLVPVALLGCAAWFGGIWIIAALLYLTGFARLLDRVVLAERAESEFPAGTALSVTLAISHFALLALSVLALAGEWMGLLEKLGLFVAAGMFFGQVSNANAHELIHRSSRLLHRLGMWVYISLLFGHHTSAHVLIHHRYVATRNDPNTSRRGESFYRFALRAWLGSFREGYAAEAARLAKINRPTWRNPYVVYVSGAVGFIVIALLISPLTLLAYVLLAGHAQMQLLMSDYVQHYGLMRPIKENGKPAPIGPQHSWNSPHWFTSAMMLNATRHSDHHAHPTRHYPALRLPEAAPMLPKPLPIMGAIALCPPVWRKIMDPLVDKVSDA